MPSGFHAEDTRGIADIIEDKNHKRISPLAGAIIITVVLLVFRWGINGLMGLKGPVRTLSYFPSCLLLGLLLVAWQKLRKERRNAVVMHRNRNGKTLAVFARLLFSSSPIS